MSKTLYEILGVAKDASTEEIQRAYKRVLAEMAIAPEPDPKALAQAKEAFQYLSSPQVRQIYDASLITGVDRPAAKHKPAPATPPPPMPKQKAPTFVVRPEEPTSSFAEILSGGWVKWAVIGAISLVIVVWWRGPRSTPKLAPKVIVQSTTVEERKTDPTEPNADIPPPPLVAVSTAPPPGSDAESVFNAVSASVARIAVFDRDAEQIGVGSGVVVGEDAMITNCHVAKNGASFSIKVGGATYNNATLSMADEEYDLCKLRIPGLAAMPVRVHGVKDLRTGQKVFAIGAPQGLELTISDGIVSSLREVPNGTVIQTTAPISPGSSGGGLFDSTGRLVGIMTFQHRFGQNLNFAVPADWIGAMRSRSGSGPIGATATGNAPPPGASVGNRPLGDTPRELVLGTWSCTGTSSGRNGEYTYNRNGTISYATNDGKSSTGRFAVSGRAVTYYIRNSEFSYQVEVLTEQKMVLNIGVEGQRLICERR
jgi:serine protease Do